MDGEIDTPCGDEALELRVRCVPGEDKVQLYLALRDGNTLSFNRCSSSRSVAVSSGSVRELREKQRVLST